MIDGPERQPGDGPGGFVEVFSVVSGVTATLTGLTISGGLAAQGGGLSVAGGTVSLTDVAVINNQAVGAETRATAGPGGSSLKQNIYPTRRAT